MLEELDIKNFALIDSSHIEFNKGFTVLSGETTQHARNENFRVEPIG